MGSASPSFSVGGNLRATAFAGRMLGRHRASAPSSAGLPRAQDGRHVAGERAAPIRDRRRERRRGGRSGRELDERLGRGRARADHPDGARVLGPAAARIATRGRAARGTARARCRYCRPRGRSTRRRRKRRRRSSRRGSTRGSRRARPCRRSRRKSRSRSRSISSRTGPSPNTGPRTRCRGRTRSPPR